MANLYRVTITGADDSCSVPEIVDLSLEFPFVEWGILVSKRQEGGYRFPSRHWIDRFAHVAGIQCMNISTHVCGKWVRQMLVGDLDWSELPFCLDVCQRVQINTHAEPHDSNMRALASLDGPAKRQFIFQWDGVNDNLANIAHSCGVNVAALFDTSGGAGILPESWPTPANEFPCGYAGGIGAENVVAQVGKIDAICGKPYWIDMERRVRTQDDSALDMRAVRRVLELTAPLISPQQTKAAEPQPQESR